MPDRRDDHIYKGAPDSRLGDAETETSRFRPRYRTLTSDEVVLHDRIKDAAAELERLLGEVNQTRQLGARQHRPRELALAMTKLEESVMWGIKALTSS